MKSRHLLLLAAITQVGFSSLIAQVNTDGVKGEVTEFTQSVKEHPDVKRTPQSAQTQQQAELNQDSEDALKHYAGDVMSTDPAQPVARGVAISENTANLPGSDANVTTAGQQYAPTGPADNRSVNSLALKETAVANRAPLTPKQIKAKKRLDKINRKEAQKLAARDAAVAAGLIPKNSVYTTSKFSMYAQLGIDDQKLGGLNLMLASKSYPTAGSFAYTAEVGALYRLSDENTMDFGLRYSLMNGLEKSQLLNRPSTGQITESQSNMWTVGLQGGLDHNLLHDSEWSVAIGLGLGFDVGGLHLTEKVQEIVTNLPADPSIPTPDEVAVVHYNVVNVNVTPRLTLRSPEMGNGWQFQARVGYQFGKNAMLRVDEFTSIRNDLTYNPSGITASAGFVAPLPRLFCR